VVYFIQNYKLNIAVAFTLKASSNGYTYL